MLECDKPEEAEKIFGYQDWNHLTKLLIVDKKVKEIKQAEGSPGEDMLKCALEKAFELGYKK